MSVLRVIYIGGFIVIFLPLSILWLVTSAAFPAIVGSLIDHGFSGYMNPIILLLYVLVGGYSLYSMFNLSYFAIARKIALSQLTKTHHLALISGSLLSLYASFTFSLLMLLPTFMVAYLYGILQLNQYEIEKLQEMVSVNKQTNPTSQTDHDQGQI